MTQLTDEHFELHTKNKAEQHERQKIKFFFMLPSVDQNERLRRYERQHQQWLKGNK